MNSKTQKIVLVGLCFLTLISIRFFEQSWFYDPFLDFFKLDYLSKSSPSFQLGKLTFSTLARYTLNSSLSVIILVVLFGQKVLKFSVYFFILVLLIALPLYVLLLLNLEKELYMFFFYVRRFLIQPIFILLLLPAFYYQEKLKKN